MLIVSIDAAQTQKKLIRVGLTMRMYINPIQKVMHRLQSNGLMLMSRICGTPKQSFIIGLMKLSTAPEMSIMNTTQHAMSNNGMATCILSYLFLFVCL